jgi:hypothetical protein
MSSRTQQGPFPVIGSFQGKNSNVSGNMAGTIISLPTIIQKESLVSYSITWTGATGSGTVTVQVSNDYALNASGGVANAGTWNTLPMSATGAVTGASGNGFADIDTLGGYATRLVYTPSGSTGTMTAVVVAKVS